jgi:uncharacterized phage protein (TIGR02220 family)
MEEKPSYYSILTANVRYDERLSANEKILFSEITALSGKYGYCAARNGYFSKLYNVSDRSITRWIKHLRELEYLKYVPIYKEGSKEVVERRLYALADSKHPMDKQVLGGRQKCLQGVDTDVEDNNINNNNINTNNSFTQDSINTKGIGILAESDNDNKNKDKTKNKDKNKKDNDNKENNRVKDKESNSNINNNSINTNKDLKGNRDKDRVNTNKDLEGNIDNECSIDKKESKGRGSSINTKIDNTCNIENECSIENEKKHTHGIDNKCSIENTCNKDLKGSKDNFDYKRFIEWFNELANKNFRDTETNRKMIRSRLNEGYTKEDVAKVVRLKVQQWKDNQKMNKYLRFTTLFAATNFSNYLQEAEDTLEPQEKKKRESSAKEKTRKTNPVEEKIQQYKLFLSEHPDNKVIKEALEQLEQSKG